ncbi:MAG: hypothetical protein RLZZ628_3674 [Bacteroidota bacterium]|jgi:hypothetical protein
MQDITPFPRWRVEYAAEDDPNSPFYGRTYNDMRCKHRIYNYYIHPRWDEFGSETLYLKILYADYNDNYCIIEMIGEWNDTLHNDIAILKQKVFEPMLDKGIYKFLLLTENVLNFHGSDDCYYEEWAEECREEAGWIALLNTFDHVAEEMNYTGLQHFIHYGWQFNHIDWRLHKPKTLYQLVEDYLESRSKVVALT